MSVQVAGGGSAIDPMQMPIDPTMGGGMPLDVGQYPVQGPPIQQAPPIEQAAAYPGMMPAGGPAQQLSYYPAATVPQTMPLGGPVAAAPTLDANTIAAQMAASPGVMSAVAGATGAIPAVAAPPAVAAAPATAAAPIVAAAPTVAGGGPVAAPGDMSSIVAQLQSITESLAGIVSQLQALTGAQGVQPSAADPSVSGGGPGTVDPGQANPKQVAQAPAGGCGCSGSTDAAKGAEQVPPPPSDELPASGSEDNSGTPASGDVRQKIVELAAAEVGVKEEGGENLGDRIVEYRKSVTGEGEDPNAPEAWCADFVSYVMDKAGVPVNDGKGEDYVQSMADWAKGNGRFKEAGHEPQPGDVIVFEWGDSNGKLDHTGIVEKVENGRVYTIEGNSADSVARRDYALGSAPVAGYITAA